MDETYLKIKGVCITCIVLVDKHVDTMDFYLSGTRDEFSSRGICLHGFSETTLINQSDTNVLALFNFNFVI
ncbi:hypothetical protein [Candidatus Enterovibrio escicola]|uniref:hypothetical protein n=1 Tax=Candidatus Enterovibrio escicola TaxID=1927127 RepID=UPI001237BD08|nr:hypothetical protein [Candidatus Enterovibrio escacola]